jgi:predicted GNAT family N-acyltransferase
VIECRILSSADEDFTHCQAIRMEVFVGEQRVPVEEEMDELDAAAVHVLALADGEPIGTGRLILADAETARIGRMAVLKARRGEGIGGAILQRLIDVARERGVRKLTLAGQLHAISFYERFGFAAHGDVFLDAGIEHRTMDRTLN